MCIRDRNKQDIDNVGTKLAMHIAAQSPIAINQDGINKNILDKELEIIRRKVPQLNEKLAEKIAESMAKLRTLDLQKNPGIAETIDWSMALLHLDITELSRENILATAGTFLKHRDDINLVEQIDLKEKLDL